jgi:UDP-N-acetylmuramoyl-L-alanyl-D-glutamate--2,6-diaminopimelate ligase
MEVSSHALDQQRIESTEFIARIFTNLTQDHLDYHPSMEAYYESKKRLFTEYSNDALSVINIDDPYGQRLLNEISGKKVSYSCKTEADVSAVKIKAGLDSLHFTAQVFGERTEVEVPLACLHNVYNVLAALATAVSLGQPLKEITEKLATFPGVKGRMERVPGTGEIPIFVDYAHTPDAFLNVLKAVRALHKGKIVTVFGCGGDRDRDKRPKMGSLAARYSDRVFITCDNPRTEDPQRIIDDICKGLRPHDLEKKCTVVMNRQEAIEEACRTADSDTIILILGKGHEEYQIIGKQKKYFSDQQVVADWMIKKSALNSECR